MTRPDWGTPGCKTAPLCPSIWAGPSAFAKRAHASASSWAQGSLTAALLPHTCATAAFLKLWQPLAKCGMHSSPQQVWLDVDNGNRVVSEAREAKKQSKHKWAAPMTLEKKFERIVEIVDTVVVFLSGCFKVDGTPSSTYFRSVYCRHEFMAAIKNNKRVVIILETDPSKGGIPLSAHLDEARNYPELQAVVAVLSSHSDRGWIVPWHRIRVFQDVSLRLALAPIVCHERDRVDEAATREGAEVFISTEVVRRPLGRLPDGCHLYVSRFNPGATDVARLMASEVQGAKPMAGRAKRGDRGIVRWTANPETKARRFLLVLNASTWDKNANPHVEQLYQCAASHARGHAHMSLTAPFLAAFPLRVQDMGNGA